MARSRGLGDVYKRQDWKRLGRLYAIVLGTVLVTLFLTIVTVRLALNIF
jgi:cytochrome c oxidase subunit IV